MTTNEDSLLSGNVLADNGNGVDSDPDSNPLSVTEVNGNAGDVGTPITLTSGALLTLNSDGTFDYDPNGQFESLNNGQTATDSFTYTIDDGNGGTDTATVTVTIDGITDNLPPVAVDDDAITVQDTAVDVLVLANDSDPDGDDLEITLATQGSNGSVAINDNGTPADTTDDFLVYTPDAGFGGLDSFTYTISDGNGGTDTATVNLAVYPYILEDNGQLLIFGTNGKDKIKVEEQSNGDLKVVVDAVDEGFKLEETIAGPIDEIIVNSLDAKDEVEVKTSNTPIDSEQFGGPGDDILKGDDGNDALYGEAGDDKLEGKDGEDNLFGGAGADELKGGYQDDALYGGADADVLKGEKGNDSFFIQVFDEAEYDIFDGGEEDLNTNPNGDTIINASGADVLLNEFRESWEIETFDGNGNGILGNDLDNNLDFRKTILQNTFVDGGLGKDEIKGSPGNDDLRGGDGDDKLEGNDGDDTLAGGEGEDELKGGKNNDQLSGNAGDDKLKGEDGDDSLTGGTGNDLLEGGKGIDILTGTDPTSLGVGEIDELKGGDQADIFVLGDSSQAYYDDGIGGNSGIADYALIADFDLSEEDVIQLNGGIADYNLNVNGSDTEILLGTEELIGIVEGEKNLALDSSAFSFV